LSGVADTDDPFLRLVREAIGPSSSVLDVGAGAGRYALALAPEVAEVIAVEPSRDLVDLMALEARDRSIENIHVVATRWEDAGDLRADVVVCYGVIGGIEDGATFMRRLDQAALEKVFLGLGSGVDVLRDPLWRHFHDVPHPPAPSFLDAVGVLAELGIAPNVDVLEYPTPIYDRLDDAVFAYRDLLQLPVAEEIDDELRTVLGAWLVGTTDGRLRVPGTSYTYAALTWNPSS
jgi:SAM-dependent methyltransferase